MKDAAGGAPGRPRGGRRPERRHPRQRESPHGSMGNDASSPVLRDVELGRNGEASGPRPEHRRAETEPRLAPAKARSRLSSPVPGRACAGALPRPRASACPPADFNPQRAGQKPFAILAGVRPSLLLSLRAGATAAGFAVVLAAAGPVAAQDAEPDDPPRVRRDVSVVASRLPEVPATAVVRVVSREEIDALPGAHTVPDVLRSVLGVDVRRRGPGGVQADVGIRGGDFNGTLVLVDGQPVNDPQSNHLSFDLDVPVAAIERIEILAGPGSAVWGSNPMGGAVNIVTRGGALGRAAVQLEGRYAHGTQSLDQGGARLAVRVAEPVTVGVDWWRAETAGFRDDTESATEILRLSSRWDTGKGPVTLGLGIAERRFGACVLLRNGVSEPAGDDAHPHGDARRRARSRRLHAVAVRFRPRPPRRLRARSREPAVLREPERHRHLDGPNLREPRRARRLDRGRRGGRARHHRLVEPRRPRPGPRRGLRRVRPHVERRGAGRRRLPGRTPGRHLRRLRLAPLALRGADRAASRRPSRSAPPSERASASRRSPSSSTGTRRPPATRTSSPRPRGRSTRA